MRKILILFCFILIPALSYTQVNIWQCNTPDECIILGDSLLKNTKCEYLLEKAEAPKYAPGSYVLIYSEKRTSENPVKLHLIFKLYMLEADSALGIEGTPLYQLKTVRGKFSDLFPIWQKYINPQADVQLLTQEKEETIRTGDNKNYIRFSFSEDSEAHYWIIDNSL